jgi:hypothetical protein
MPLYACKKRHLRRFILVKNGKTRHNGLSLEVLLGTAFGATFPTRAPVAIRAPNRGKPYETFHHATATKMERK